MPTDLDLLHKRLKAVERFKRLDPAICIHTLQEMGALNVTDEEYRKSYPDYDRKIHKGHDFSGGVKYCKACNIALNPAFVMSREEAIAAIQTLFDTWKAQEAQEAQD